jgi:hypothetical protein
LRVDAEALGKAGDQAAIDGLEVGQGVASRLMAPIAARYAEAPIAMLSRLDTGLRIAKKSMERVRMGRHYMPMILKEFLVTSH